MELSPFWFGLYKLAKYAVYPYTWLIVLIGSLTLLLLLPQASKRLGWIRLAALLALLVAGGLGSPLVATQLIGPLEEQYPPFDMSAHQRFDAIVVLGGGVQVERLASAHSCHRRNFSRAHAVRRGSV